MRGVKINFRAKGAKLEFNESVEGFLPTVQNAVVFTGQKVNSDHIRPEKGTDLLKNAVQGGLSNPGVFMQELAEIAIAAQLFSRDNDDEINEHELENFQLELDEWFGDAARIKIGARSSTGEEISTDYILS